MAISDAGRLWPLFILAIGGVSLWMYGRSLHRDPDQIFFGIAALGVGLFFLVMSLELRLPVMGRMGWRRMGEFWPAYFLIGGGAYFAQALVVAADRRRLLLLAAGAAAAGLSAMAVTLDLVSELWLGRLALPVALAAAALGLTWLWMRRGGNDHRR